MADHICWSKTNVFDFVPCDNVANVVLGAAAEVVARSASASGATRDAFSSSFSSSTHPGYPTSIPVLHSSSSTNNPVTFFEIFRGAIHPFFCAHPAPKSLRVGLGKRPYVSPDSPSLYVRDGSAAFLAKRASKNVAFWFRCLYLRAKGQPDLARRLAAGWKSFSLYCNAKYDFGLFYCSSRCSALARALPADEQRQMPLLFEGDWSEYETQHCFVLSKRYFGERKKQSAPASAPAAPASAPAAPTPAPASNKEMATILRTISSLGVAAT